MKTNWQKDIHDRLGSYEKDAPEGLWEGISRRMPKLNDGGMLTDKPQRTTKFRMWRVAGVAAAASVALVIGYNFLGNDTKDNINIPTNTTKHPNMLASSQKPLGNEPTGVSAEQATHSADDLLSEQPKLYKAYTEQPTLTSASTETDVKEISSKEENSKKENGQAEMKPEKRKDNRMLRKNQDDALLAYNDVTERSGSSDAPSRWSVSTGAMGGLGASGTTTAYGDYLVLSCPGGADTKDSPMLDMSSVNRDVETKTEYEHHLPIRIGLSVAYALTDRLSISSGLTYTRLASDIKDASRESKYIGEQRLHYVGIPVNVSYKVASFRWLGLYGTAGVLAEKCVSGTTDEGYVENNTMKYTNTHDISSKPLQMSVNAGVGIQFNVHDNVGIYAEPGLSYYFDDGSALQTIYKEKPLNFNLNVGVRFKLSKF
ncbi:outer membrane beta-barrel protein [Prevotella sp.]|uniref:outer membrane beta-barrel protein n=1 Tax=Prevotella sp. TaxID=59823 RepID=UPI0025FA9A04|nr:porin family protein [Prevotella sp.]